VRAQQTAEQILHVSWERLGLVPADQVRRVSKRPVMILTLPERQRVVRKCVRGVCKVTLYAGGLLPLLLGASWRVWRAKRN